MNSQHFHLLLTIERRRVVAQVDLYSGALCALDNGTWSTFWLIWTGSSQRNPESNLGTISHFFLLVLGIGTTQAIMTTSFT